MKYTNQEFQTMLQSILFQGMQEKELKALLPCLRDQKRTYQKGEWIYTSGEIITSIGLILTGSAHVERIDYLGNRHIITALIPHDVFGESQAAGGAALTDLSVQADEETTVLFVNLQAAIRMCSSACPYHARLIHNLISLLATKNLQLNQKLTYVTQHSLRDKILTYLYAVSKTQRSSYFTIPFNRQQLADYLNVDRSALSNELSQLKKEGVLDYQKNRFHFTTAH